MYGTHTGLCTHRNHDYRVRNAQDTPPGLRSPPLTLINYVPSTKSGWKALASSSVEWGY